MSSPTPPRLRIERPLQNRTQIDLRLVQDAVCQDQSVATSPSPILVALRARLPLGIRRIKKKMAGDGLRFTWRNQTLVLEFSQASCQLDHSPHLHSFRRLPKRLESPNKCVPDVCALGDSIDRKPRVFSKAPLILRANMHASLSHAGLDALVIPAPQDRLAGRATEIDRLDPPAPHLPNDLSFDPRKWQGGDTRECRQAFLGRVKLQINRRIQAPHPAKTNTTRDRPDEAGPHQRPEVIRRGEDAHIGQSLIQGVQSRRQIRRLAQALITWMALGKKHPGSREPPDAVASDFALDQL